MYMFKWIDIRIEHDFGSRRIGYSLLKEIIEVCERVLATKREGRVCRYFFSVQ